jgi:hypothetical protein
MSLQLSRDQIRAVLANLSMSEKMELLRLLQLRQQIEDEAPRDDRLSIAQTFAGLRDERASKATDPEGFRAAWDKHEAAAAAHFKKLEAEQPPPSVWPGIAATMAWHAERYAESKAMATADGCPDPCDAPQKPEALGPDPIELVRRKTLPRATLRDVQDTQVRHAETAIYQSIRDAQDAHFYKPVPEQRLADFRVSPYAPLTPPSYPDA